MKLAVELGLLPSNVSTPALGIVTPELEKCCKEPKIIEAVQKDIEALGRERKLMGYELPKLVEMRADIMTIPNGLLTPTNKVKREVVLKASLFEPYNAFACFKMRDITI